MDGANVIQQYRYVKIPYIRPVIIANCILVLNGSLRSFDISYLLTKGGPGNSSELMSTYMYKQAFTSMKYGYGSAVAMVIVAICLIVGFLFRRFTEIKDQEKYFYRVKNHYSSPADYFTGISHFLCNHLQYEDNR